MMVEHTPTPWRISGKTVIRTDTGHTPSDELIGSLDWRNRPANAEFIVRAVNAHGDLVAALKECGQLLGKMMPLLLGQDDRWVEKMGTALFHTHDALAKADGRS